MVARTLWIRLSRHRPQEKLFGVSSRVDEEKRESLPGVTVFHSRAVLILARTSVLSEPMIEHLERLWQFDSGAGSL